MRETRKAAGLCAVILVSVFAVMSCGGAGASGTSDGYAVPAVREPLTSDSASPVVHDNEVMALAAHAGRLFAATDQWEYQGPSAYGQVLVKDSSSSPWRVFEQTQSSRVQALDSFPVPANQGLGPGHSLLITQAIVDGRSRIQWLLDGATSFTAASSHALPSTADAVRSFGAHESDGVWSVYAGDSPAGVLRGKWSRARHTLVFGGAPELAAAPPGSPGLKTQKITGFADCGGALYVTINTKLYRRNDGVLPSGAARWVLVYQEPPVGAFNSGLRGLSCVWHDGSPALLLSTEGSGAVYRIDRLPHGQLDVSATAAPGGGLAGLTPVLEFAPVPSLRQILASEGVQVPVSGNGSIGYVIAAYNDFTTVKIGGAVRQIFGFEWGYQGECPQGARCGPVAFSTMHFGASACFAVRTGNGISQAYTLRCLGGPDFTPSGEAGNPVRPGQAFVSIRDIRPSPFGDSRLYYAGYDCNFYPADGTAWAGSSTLTALRL
jgi:hypothetical protein